MTVSLWIRLMIFKMRQHTLGLQVYHTKHLRPQSQVSTYTLYNSLNMKNRYRANYINLIKKQYLVLTTLAIFSYTNCYIETIPEVDEEYHIESARISEKSEKVKPSSARSKRSARSRSGTGLVMCGHLCQLFYVVIRLGLFCTNFLYTTTRTNHYCSKLLS